MRRGPLEVQTRRGLAHLAPLTRLRRLDLFRTRVTDAGLDAIAAIGTLEQLNLDYTKVTGAGLARLHPLKNLRELRLNSAAIGDDNIGELAAFPALRRLNIYHTLVTDKGFEKLKSALPRCEVIYDRDSSLPNRRGS